MTDSELFICCKSRILAPLFQNSLRDQWLYIVTIIHTKMSNIRVLSLIKISIFNLSTISNHPRVTNCSRMQISDLFLSEDLHSRSSAQQYPVYGRCIWQIRCEFKNRTWSVRNAELVIYASFSTLTLPGKTNQKFNQKNIFTFLILSWTLKS